MNPTENRILRAPFSPIVRAVEKIFYKSVLSEHRPEGKSPEQLSAPVMLPGFQRALRLSADLWQQKRSRIRVIHDVRKIYDGDPDYKAQVRAILTTAAKKGPKGSPFQLEIISKDGNTKLAEELTAATAEFIQRPAVRLAKRVKEYGRWLLNEGDVFLEKVIAWPEKELVAARRLPGVKEGFVTQVEKDSTGNVAGYLLIDLMEQKIVGIYEAWQIAHMSWERDGDYGRPLIDSAIKKFKRLDALEESLALMRDEARVRIARKFSTETPEPMIEDMRAKEEQITEESGTAARDIWTTLGIEVIDPKATALTSIPDLEFLKVQLLDAGGAPKAILGGRGEEVNRATLDRQLEHHGDLAGDVCDEIGDGYEDIIKTQWLLWGVDASKFDLSLNWTKKTIEILMEQTERIYKFKTAGIYTTRRARIEAGIDPDQAEAEEEAEAEREAEAMFLYRRGEDGGERRESEGG